MTWFWFYQSNGNWIVKNNQNLNVSVFAIHNFPMRIEFKTSLISNLKTLAENQVSVPSAQIFFVCRANSVNLIVYTRDAQLRFNGGPKKCCWRIRGPDWLSSFHFYIVYTSKIKPNVCKLELWGPDWKLSRATFGPRAVCCACLIYTNPVIYSCVVNIGLGSVR